MLTKLSLTLVFLTLSQIVTTSLASVDVNRRHGNLNRLIKRRSPFDPFAPIVGAGADPESTTSLTATPTLGQPLSTTSSGTGVIQTTVLPSETLATSDTLSVSSSSSTSSSSASSSSSSTRSTSIVKTSPTVVVPMPTASFGPQSISAVFITSTAPVPSATSTAAASSSTGKHTTTTVLIVIAASVGGIAVIWTIIRKWKFRPSSQFEGRMQPIDWQPTTSPEEGAAAHRRNASNASSFHSGLEHGENMAGRGLQPGYGATQDQTLVAGLPEHDFTPGATNLAPVGGYADLARGPSPQPQMHEVLTRGPSTHRMQYGHPGAPMHPQAYPQDAYDYNGGAY